MVTTDYPFASKIAYQALPKQIQKQLRPSESASIKTLIFTEDDDGSGVIEVETRSGRGLVFTWKPVEKPNPHRPDVTHYWALTDEYENEDEEEVGNRSRQD